MNNTFLPNVITNEEVSGGEKKFHQILKDSSLNGYTIIHSVYIGKHPNKKNGQCDFVLIGPDGWFVFEVKGGSEHHWDPANGYKWGWPGDSSKLNESDEPPGAQAQGNEEALTNYFFDKIDQKKLHPFKGLFGHGVIFPEAKILGEDIGLVNEIKFDLSSSSFDFFFKNFLNYQKSRRSSKLRPVEKLRVTEISYLSRLIRSKIHSVPFVNSKDSTIDLLRIDSDLKEQITEIDFDIHLRMLIKGGAGTGKSIFAKFIAEKYSLDDKKILWISKNIPFTDEISEVFKDNFNIEVITVDKLYKKYLDQYGYEWDINFTNNDSRFADCVYENEDDIKKFDLLIVDEAQDFLTEFFILGADNLIKNGLENGEWLICLDADYQANIHKKLNTEALKDLQKLATNNRIFRVNKRNPLSVIQRLNDYLDETIESDRIFRGLTKVLINSKDSEKRELTNPLFDENFLENYVYNLFKSGEREITILMNCSAKEISHKINFKYLESLKQINDQSFQIVVFGVDTKKTSSLENKGIVHCYNYMTFKGCEKRNIVIYWDLDDFNNKEYKDEFYTALTRTTECAHILLEDGLKNKFVH
jgi:hypothetical protein